MRNQNVPDRQDTHPRARSNSIETESRSARTLTQRPSHADSRPSSAYAHNNAHTTSTPRFTHCCAAPPIGRSPPSPIVRGWGGQILRRTRERGKRQPQKPGSSEAHPATGNKRRAGPSTGPDTERVSASATSAVSHGECAAMKQSSHDRGGRKAIIAAPSYRQATEHSPVSPAPGGTQGSAAKACSAPTSQAPLNHSRGERRSVATGPRVRGLSSVNSRMFPSQAHGLACGRCGRRPPAHQRRRAEIGDFRQNGESGATDHRVADRSSVSLAHRCWRPCGHLDAADDRGFGRCCPAARRAFDSEARAGAASVISSRSAPARAVGQHPIAAQRVQRVCV
jgi:hypothetical protein